MKIVKASNQEIMSPTSRRGFLEAPVRTKRPSNNSCGSLSSGKAFSGRRSHRLTNFPDTIVATVLDGTGAYPGPTTNGCGEILDGMIEDCASVPGKEQDARTEVILDGLEVNGKSGPGVTTGAENVLTKDGTILPWLEEL